MNRRAIFGLLALIGLMLCLLVGCGKNNDIVAKVGKEEIKVDELKDFVKYQQITFATADEEFKHKRQQLDSLISLHLLIQLAYEKGMDKSEDIARLVLANRDKFMLSSFWDREIGSKVKITDADVKQYYDRLATRIRVSQIVTATQDSAALVLEKIKGGMPFDEAAFEFSKDPGAKRTYGDIGYVVYGSLPPTLQEFERAAFALEAGEVSPPIKTEVGYHIIKVVEKQPNESRGEYESVREQLRAQLTGLMQQRETYVFLKGLREKYPFTVDRTTADYVMHKRTEIYPPQLLQTLPTNDFDEQQLDRNERDLVLATWEGGQITLMQYIEAARGPNVAQQRKPSFNEYDALGNFIFEVFMTDVLLYDANKIGVENDESFKTSISRFKDYAMADILKFDSIPGSEPPSEDRVRKYYDEHPDDFTNPAKVHVFEIETSDELLANRLAREIRSLDQFKKAAAQYTERPAQKGKDGDLGYVERRWFPEIFDLAQKSPLGAVAGPVVGKGKYSVFYLIDRVSAELKEYQAVKREIMQRLMVEDRASRYAQWLAERRTQVDVTVNEDAIWTLIDKTKYASADTTRVGG